MGRCKVGKSVLLTAGFTLLLTSVFYLAHDGILENSRIIGWQAYTSIDLRKSSSSLGSSAISDAGTSSSNSSISSGSAEVQDIFPLDFYAPLLPNPAPITEITVHSCLPLTRCSPKTTPTQDATLGKWVQVDRSLSPAGQLSASAGGFLSNIFGSIEQRFIFYRKSRRRDVPHVVELKLVQEGQTPSNGNDGWHRIKNGLRSKVVKLMAGDKGIHLYYRTTHPPVSEQAWQDKIGLRNKDAGDEPITELDLVYGDNPPWPGFETAGVVSNPHSSIGSAQVSLSFRRKPTRKPPLTPLKFNPNGAFKILQLADLHFSVSPEPCRDYDRSDPLFAGRDCIAKNDTLAFVDTLLDSEKPDLVVLTGDQLNGQDTSWDPRSVLSLYTTPLIKRKIPYAVILGNHDSESGPLTREEQMQVIAAMPFSYSHAGPAMVTGAGNYMLKIESGQGDAVNVANLWFMDSGTHAEKDPWKPWSKPGYGYIHKDQIEWFKSKYSEVKAVLLPYRKDSAKDLPPQNWRRGKVWEAGADQEQTLGRPPAVVFMHIPVPEAHSPPDRTEYPKVINPTFNLPATSGVAELVVGSRNETATLEGAQSQPGIFDVITSLNHAPPTASPESLHNAEYSSPSPSTASAQKGGVRLLVHGHNHLNEDCRRIEDVWICFGGGASFAAYGQKDIRRRARVIVLEDFAARIRTYHRIASADKETAEKRWDEFVLT